jgi:hypothetical protein
MCFTLYMPESSIYVLSVCWLIASITKRWCSFDALTKLLERRWLIQKLLQNNSTGRTGSNAKLV